jgi:hypothetical protein
MAFESRNRAARSGLASTPRHGGFLVKSRPGSTGTLGRLRAQLLGGAAGIALPAASMVVALGVGLPTEAQAQTSSFNGTQATTYTLTTGANTGTFTFGPNTVIGPTPAGPGVDARNQGRSASLTVVPGGFHATALSFYRLGHHLDLGPGAFAHDRRGTAD